MWYTAALKDSSEPTPIPEYVPPSWSDGTNEEIILALRKHYHGDIDLTEYWSVGDERTIHVNAIDSTNVTQAYEAQDIVMVIMHVGGKELSTPFPNHTECTFIVGMKSVMVRNGYSPNNMGGSMNAKATNTGGWGGSYLRSNFANTKFKRAIDSSIAEIFKSFKNPYMSSINDTTGSGSSVKDYFSVPSLKEITGISAYESSSDIFQFDYYKTTANQTKYVMYDGASTSVAYWTRTIYSQNSGSVSYYAGAGGMSNQTSITPISLFGVI